MAELDWQIVVALSSALSAVAGVLYRETAKRLEACEQAQAALRNETTELLRQYRERDEAERLAWRKLLEQQQVAPGSGT